jgi:membrane-bound lytic murein transglycosylase D
MLSSPGLVDDPGGDVGRSRVWALKEGPVPGDSRYGRDLLDDAEADGTVQVPPGLAVPTYPVVINAPVEALIDQFVARDRERFGMWISRSGRYLPMIQRIFREKGLPEELAYTAMIESGFSPRAVSRVGAKGMWQFMEATGRRYKLVINRWMDERLDPVKSTIAAATWVTSMACSATGSSLRRDTTRARPGLDRRSNAPTSDFWALTQTRHLPDETKLFVPQILAATVITRAPSRYGFDVTLESPLAFDEVVLRRSRPRHDREPVGRGRARRDLNPSLLARITPPSRHLRATAPPAWAPVRGRPPGRVPSRPPVLDGAPHRPQRDPDRDCAAVSVTVQRLAELNHLPGGRLRGVRELVVPVASAPAATAPVPPGAPREVVVRKGDTLSAIAARYRVTPQALAQINGMDVDDPLAVGARLRLTAP